ncbi:MAG TPA: hypothetical protein VKR06_11965 [Ktedonosporobacter sp.]|nr:hypothetical protein [Ktedonosporobacter sp.]
MMNLQQLVLWLLIVGLVPYTIRWQRSKGHKRNLEIRALFWSLQVCFYSTRCRQLKVRLPLVQRLGRFVWEVVKEVLKDKLLKQ